MGITLINITTEQRVRSIRNSKIVRMSHDQNFKYDIDAPES